MDAVAQREAGIEVELALLDPACVEEVLYLRLRGVLDDRQSIRPHLDPGEPHAAEGKVQKPVQPEQRAKDPKEIPEAVVEQDGERHALESKGACHPHVARMMRRDLEADAVVGRPDL